MALISRLKNSNFYFFEILVLVFLFLVFLYIPYNWHYSKKVIYFCSVISLICYLFSAHRRRLLNTEILLIASIFIYGASFSIY